MEENVKALSHVKKLIEDLNNDVSLNIKVDDIVNFPRFNGHQEKFV